MEPALNSIKAEQALIHQRLDTIDAALSLLSVTADELEKRLIPVLAQPDDGQTSYYGPQINLVPGESPISQRITDNHNALGKVIDQIKNLISRLQV